MVVTTCKQCLHVNMTVITFVTVNCLVLLNTFDMSINDNTVVIIQYQVNTHASNDILDFRLSP